MFAWRAVLLLLGAVTQIQATCPDGERDCAAGHRRLAAVAIQVKSAGWSDGNLAQFYVNGTQLSVPTGRGLNVVVLRPDASLSSSAAFDTSGAGSDALVALFKGLTAGTPVLVAAMDEAAGNLTIAARAALKTLGATLIDGLAYRGSYALVGMKGGAALAEQQLPETGGVANITAVYSPGAAPAPAPPVVGSANLTVRSAAWSDGNVAQFYINGTQLSVGTGRGLNVVVLRPDGSMLSSYVFDTFAGGSDAFVAMVKGLATGTPVLVAAMDEAQTNLTAAAKASIKSLGGTLIDGLLWRSSYALIGIKGGTALAESILPEHGGVARASSAYSVSVISTTTTTTASTAGPMTNITVRSAAWSDGNVAQFYINGTLLSVNTGRGLNVMVLQANGAMQGFYVFDTFASGSDAFAARISSLPQGTPVLVAARDEASNNLTAAAKAAIKSLGGSLIDGMGFRSSYALIGIKGSSALAEVILPEHGGLARASAGYPPLPSAWSPGTGTSITVRSAAWSDGNLATFYLNGSQLSVTTGRGMNAVVLRPDGSMLASYTFDTWGAGSDALVSAIAGLALGTPVLLAARDEAQTNLTTAAKAAIRSLGASMVDSIQWRSSYALIGIKGGTALAETVLPEKGGVAVASGQYRPGAPLVPPTTPTTTTTTTTTATTTVAPDCSRYSCPSGSMLKANHSVYVGAGPFCCGPEVDGLLPVSVKSGGFDDGNIAAFFAGGMQLNVPPGRGMNLVALRPDGSVKAAQAFDTYLAGSAALVSFVESQQAGTVVLVAAVDEAFTNLTAGAKDAIRSLGGSLIGQMSWRGSYALIGVKNGSAIAERVLRRQGGLAFVSGYVEVAKPTANNLPVCPARSANPPVAGYLSNGQLNLEAGCRYQLWDRAGAATCLEGGWTIIVGGSNTILMAIRLADILADEGLLPIRDGASMGSATIVDVIIDQSKGGVVYRNTQLINACNRADQPLGLACRTALASAVAAAPAYTGQGTRVTLFQAQYWDQATMGLDVARSDAKWSTAKVAVLVQVGTWYIYCSVKQVSWCTRPALIPQTGNAGLQVYRNDMAASLTILKDLCKKGGRAEQFGCIVGANSWQNPPLGEMSSYEAYNTVLMQEVAPFGSEILRTVDFWTLGEAMQSEEYGGHSSPVMMHWNWQVMLGGMCPSDLAAQGATAQFIGDNCFAGNARWDYCPDYKANCNKNPPISFRCELWECMNSVPCTMQVSSVAVAKEDTNGTCGAAIPVSFPTVEEAAGRLCRRIWCDDSLEWVLPVVVWSLVILMCLLWRYGERLLPERLRAKLAPAPKKPAKPAPTKDTTVAPAAGAKDQDAGSPKAAQKVAGGGGEVEEKAHSTLVIPCMASAGALQDSNLTMPTVQGDDSGSADVDVNAGDWRCHGCGTANHAGQTDCSMCDLHHWVDPMASEAEAEEVDSDDGGSEPVSPRTPLRDADSLVAITFENAGDAEPEADATVVHPLPHKHSVRTIRSKASKGSRGKKVAPVADAAGDKFPLGLARFCGSTHVVVGHLYALGATPSDYFYGWGFTWVPWFFMMSGFVLMTANLRRPKDETMLDYAMRRSVTIYPLYAVSLIPAFAIAKAANQAPSWPVLLSQSFLAQALVPLWTEQALQSHCWFLSAMVVYWFCFKPMGRCIRWLGMYSVVAVMSVLFLLPWLVIWIPASTKKGVLWYEEHKWGDVSTSADIGVVMLKFHPICYAHVFVIGALLARLRLLLDAKAVASGLSKWWSRPLELVAPLGYLGLVLVFSVRTLQPSGFKLSARLSVLLPFQALILFGLAGLPSLPLARCAWLAKKLDFLENYSFAVYVFQFIAYDFWPKQGVVNIPLFFIFLWGLCFIIVHTIQRPVQKWWGAHSRGRLAVPFVLGGLLVGLSFIPRKDTNIHAADLPAMVRWDDGMVDVRLPLVDPQDGASAIMNPSLAIINGKLVIAARAHRLEYARSLAEYVVDNQTVPATFIDVIWHSKIVVGQVDLDDEGWARWPSTGVVPFAATMTVWDGLQTPSNESWTKLCSQDEWIPANNTLIRQIVTGPEDPKLVGINGSISMLFDSMPPEGSGTCPKETTNTQMYLADGVEPSALTLPRTGFRLACGNPNVDEKNWIPFTYQGSLNFVYSPLPHVVLSSGGAGVCGKLYDSSFKPLLQLSKENKLLDFRGSAQAILIDDAAATPNLPRPHYLALLHVFDRKTSGYAHLAYRFSASPPFNILQVSTQLPLMNAQAERFKTPFAFANGLVVHNRTVVISYGAGDRDARALVLTLARLDEMFTCSGEDTPIIITTNASSTNATNASSWL